MKAYVLRSYGSPDQLEPAELDKPKPGAGEVLVRVRATSVQPYDWHHMRGEPYVARFMPGGPGLRAPGFAVLGADLAGVVEEVGRDVTEFAPGDEVYAMAKGGGFAEYACVPENILALKPSNLTFEEAASVPMAACTALLALRYEGGLEPGQHVLINGASGGVGTFAVQLAKAYGARVTAVCSTRNVDRVRSLGADEVIDYTKQDFTLDGPRYDLLVYVSGNRSFSACRRTLKRKGAYVMVGGSSGRWMQPAGRVFSSLAKGLFVPQKVAVAEVVGHKELKRMLTTLTDLIESGEVTPVVDRVYPFEDLRAAVRYQEEGHAPGKVVITV